MIECLCEKGKVLGLFLFLRFTKSSMENLLVFVGKKNTKIFVFHLVTNNLVIIFATFLTKKEPEFPSNILVMWKYWVFLTSVINVENSIIKK